MKFFIILNRMRMQNGIKYDIGKIYHMNNKLIIHSFASLSFEDLNLTSELKIYDITVNKKSNSFKIIKEIDYKSFITQNKINIKNFNKISILKLQDEKTINNLIINKEGYYFKYILQTNNRKYIDFLIDNEEQLGLTLPLFLKYELANDNLKKLSFSKAWENKYIVAKVGRPTDLNFLNKTSNDKDVIGEILKNGRRKDVDRYILSNDSYLLSKIAETGIDDYLDILIQNTNILLKACAVINSKIKENKFHVSSYRTKKGMGKLFVKEDNSKLIRKDLANDIQNIIKNRLFEIYSKKRELKNVYVEEELKDINISNGKRTSSKGNSIPYGSAFNLDDNTNILRTFIHWTNKEDGESVDIDSSFIFFDEDMNKQTVCSYYDLQKDYAIHSGDFTDGGCFNGPGVAEMIDINIEKAIECEVRYVVAMVNQYTGDHFSEVPCKFGWMEFNSKKDKDFGPLKKFNKEAVKKSIELNSNCHEVLPCMIDLVERKIIWMDQQKEYVKNGPKEFAAGRNADSETLGTMYSAIGVLTYPSFKLYDLIELHIMARGGTIVKNKEDANTVFTVFHANVDEFPNANEFISAEDSDLIDADLISGKLSIYDKKE